MEYFPRRPEYIYLAELFFKQETLHVKVVEKSEHTFYKQFTFPKIVPFMKYFGKMWWSQRGHTQKYRMTHALCMLDN
jgi:hypothetical protein